MRQRPYVLAALLFAVACLLLPTPTPAQEPASDDGAQVADVIGELAEIAPEEAPAPAAAAAEEDAAEGQAPPVSDEVAAEVDGEAETARGPPPVEIDPPTLADMHGSLIAAITAEAGNQVRVDAATDALNGARQALAEAEAAHGLAMSDQGEYHDSVRAAAQALVDFIVATFLQPAQAGG